MGQQRDFLIARPPANYILLPKFTERVILEPT